jgi:hypothetical protein
MRYASAFSVGSLKRLSADGVFVRNVAKRQERKRNRATTDRPTERTARSQGERFLTIATAVNNGAMRLEAAARDATLLPSQAFRQPCPKHC